MKLLYEAANGVEAHMIADLLAQEGITTRTDGEYLQGAAGGLPATGMVRVMVEDEQYDAGREAINRWNAAQPVEATTTAKPLATPARWPYLIAGLIFGVAASYAYVRTPTHASGIDHNRDGILDEKWTYAADGTILKVESDRNLDGKVDMITHYESGLATEAESDDDFNGTFETRTRYRLGNPQVATSDTNGDGFEDMRTTYVYGVISTIEYLEPRSGHPLKIEHYKLGKITHAEIDTNSDGAMDRRVTYDQIGEVSKSESIGR